MNQIHLEPNTTKIVFRNPRPNGELLHILPGEALYDSATGYIHILKDDSINDPILLQLLPIKVPQTERNRAIARVGSVLLSAFGIDFFEEDNLNEVANFLFDESVNISFNALADVISVMTAKIEGLGYYDMKTKELVFGFPIVMPGY